MKVKLLTLIFTLITLITACSDGGEAISTVQDSENSFPPQKEDPFSPPSEDNNQPSPETNEIIVEVQATEAMLASWDRTLFNLITPEQALAFRGMSPVKVKDLSVVQVNRTLSSSSAPNVKLDYTTQENGDGTYSLLFSTALDIPAQMDVLVRAQLNNGTILWAPLINNGSIIQVNIVSTYLVESLMQGVRDRDLVMTELRPCGQQYGCENQHEARLLIWFGLSQSIQNFDITLPSGKSASELKAFLNQQTDFQNVVNSGINSVLEEAFVGAVSQQLDFTNLLQTTTSLYHSVFYSMGMSEREPTQDSAGSILFNRVSATATSLLNDGSTEYIYPSLTETRLRTTVTTHSLYGELPYERLTLSQTAPESFTLNENLTAEVNTFSSAPSSSYVNTAGFLNFAQIPYQSITGKNTAAVRGWLTNPYYVNLYGDEDHNYLAAATVNTGSVYDLKSLGNGQYQRNRAVESTNEFNFSMSLPANTEELDVSEASSGKTYGVIQLTQTLNATADIPVMAAAQLALWNNRAGVIQEGPGGGSLAGFYSQTSLSRDRQNGFTGALSAVTSAGLYQLADLPSVVYDSTLKAQVEKNIGRVQLTRSAAPFATGAAAPDASRMSFVVRSGDTRGYIDAVELATEINSLTEEVYQLQGHSIGMTETENRLVSYNGSTLTILSDGSAQLSLMRQTARQNVSTLKISPLSPVGDLAGPLQAGFAVVEGRVMADFGEVNGANLQIKGFVSRDKSSLHLLIQHGDAVGLLWGFQKLELPKS